MERLTAAREKRKSADFYLRIPRAGKCVSGRKGQVQHAFQMHELGCEMSSGFGNGTPMRIEGKKDEVIRNESDCGRERERNRDREVEDR